MPLPECTRVPDDPIIMRDLEGQHWRFIEYLEVYGREPVMAPYEQLGEQADHEELVRLALATGGHTRLYKDPTVTDDEADAYRLGVLSDSDYVMYQDGGLLAWDDDFDVARINMICVDPRRRGEGIGRNLLCAWMTMHVGKKQVLAGTQSDNEAAKGLYKSLGFKMVSREATFHR